MGTFIFLNAQGQNVLGNSQGGKNTWRNDDVHNVAEMGRWLVNNNDYWFEGIAMGPDNERLPVASRASSITTIVQVPDKEKKLVVPPAPGTFAHLLKVG